MRKNKAIYATYIIVGVLSFFGMSHFAYAANVYLQGTDSSGEAVIPQSGSFSTLGSFIISGSNRDMQGGGGQVILKNNSGFPITSISFGIATSSSDTSFTRACYFSGSLPVGGDYVLSDLVCSQSVGNDLIVGHTYYIRVNVDSPTGVTAKVQTDVSGLLLYGIIWDNGGSGGGFNDTSTRFISVTPSGGSVVATGTVSLGFSFYLNTDDWDFDELDQYFSVRVRPIEPLTVQPDILFGPIYATTSGLINFSTTTVIDYIGRQQITVQFFEPSFHIFGIPWGYSASYATSSLFTVSTTTPFGRYLGGIDEALRGFLASTTASLGAACNPIGGNFSVEGCLLGIFVPSDAILAEDWLLFKQIPPWGYAFRLYDVFSNPATTSLPVFSATVPPGVPGAGASFSVTTNGVLDSVLNATSGTFLSVGANSTSTLYEITSPYWNFFVYLALGLYVLRRLLGQHIVGGFGDKGSLSDTGSDDDSYRLKEYLYNHRKK